MYKYLKFKNELKTYHFKHTIISITASKLQKIQDN